MTRLFQVLLFLLVLSAFGCGASHAIRQPLSRGYLRFEIEPQGAEIAIDEKYSGVIDGWVGGVIPVEPGMRRVTLRADGYITQRFDIEVAAGEEVTLQLQMERSIELDEEPAPVQPSRRSRLGALR